MALNDHFTYPEGEITWLSKPIYDEAMDRFGYAWFSFHEHIQNMMNDMVDRIKRNQFTNPREFEVAARSGCFDFISGLIQIGTIRLIYNEGKCAGVIFDDFDKPNTVPVDSSRRAYTLSINKLIPQGDHYRYLTKSYLFDMTDLTMIYEGEWWNNGETDKSFIQTDYGYPDPENKFIVGVYKED